MSLSKVPPVLGYIAGTYDPDTGKTTEPIFCNDPRHPANLKLVPSAKQSSDARDWIPPSDLHQRPADWATDFRDWIP